jgi:hypothetical protein
MFPLIIFVVPSLLSLSFHLSPFEPSRPPSLSISPLRLLQWLSWQFFVLRLKSTEFVGPLKMPVRFALSRDLDMYFISRACRQHVLLTVCDESTAWIETLDNLWAKISWKRRHSSTLLHMYESGTLAGLLRCRVAPSSPVHCQIQLQTSGSPALLQIFLIFMLVFIYYLLIFEYQVHMILSLFL